MSISSVNTVFVYLNLFAYNNLCGKLVCNWLLMLIYDQRKIFERLLGHRF